MCDRDAFSNHPRFAEDGALLMDGRVEKEWWHRTVAWDLYLQGFPEVSQEGVKGEGSASSSGAIMASMGGVCDSFFPSSIHRAPPVRKVPRTDNIDSQIYLPTNSVHVALSPVSRYRVHAMPVATTCRRVGYKF